MSIYWLIGGLIVASIGVVVLLLVLEIMVRAANTPKLRSRPRPRLEPLPVTYNPQQEEKELKLELDLIREAKEWQAERAQYLEQQRQERQARREADRQRLEDSQAEHERILADFPTWLIVFAERLGLAYSYDRLNQLRAWILFIFDWCDQQHYGRFPINKLFKELNHCSRAPSPGWRNSLNSHRFFLYLSRILVEEGVLIAKGGPRAYKLADNARQRLYISTSLLVPLRSSQINGSTGDGA